jgi:cytochrome oxidase Cu insertion factor (SCO1/SenC/PrrC family)
MKPSPRRWFAALAVAACVGTALGVGLGLARTRSAPSRADVGRQLELHGQAHWAPGSKRAPDFALEGAADQRVSLRSQRGRLVLLTFLDSRCKRACPLEGRALGQVERELGGSHVPVALDVVTVNPSGDTTHSIHKFIRESRWTLPWHWLGGSPSMLSPVWRSYGIDVKPAQGDIAHSVVLYVIDAHGFMRVAYLFPFAPRDVAQDIRRIGSA